MGVKSIFFGMLIILLLSFVFAANGWEEFLEDGDATPVNEEEETPVYDAEIVNSGGESDELFSDSFGAEKDSAERIPSREEIKKPSRFTEDFYLALKIVAVGILFLIIFIYLFFRRPRDRWKR